MGEMCASNALRTPHSAEKNYECTMICQFPYSQWCVPSAIIRMFAQRNLSQFLIKWDYERPKQRSKGPNVHRSLYF